MIAPLSNEVLYPIPRPVWAMASLSNATRGVECLQTASSRAKSTGKRHRIVDEDGRLLDLMDP